MDGIDAGEMHAMTRPQEAASRQPYLEVLEDGFCALDGEWRVTYWNAAAERMLRLPRDQVLGRVVWSVLPFLRRSGGHEQLLRVRQSGIPLRFLESRTMGGVRRFASVHAARLPDGGLAVHFRDATDEVLRAEQHAALLESIRDGFVAVDRKWNVVYMNTAAESLLRISRDQLVGVPLWSVLPRGPKEIAECLRATMEDGLQRHLREVRPEGRVFRGRVFDLWTYPLVGGGISLLFEDVSDRLQREKELARLASEAQEANEAKSRFFAAVSHELRTPLNAIVGYVHLLQTGTYGALPEGATRAATRAGVCAEHLARLVDDVLLLTTAELGRIPVVPSTVVLQEYLPAVAEPLRIQAEEKGLAFSLAVPVNVPPLETDAQRLRQLLVGLLSNAVKFTAQGTVALTATLREAPEESAAEGAYDLFPDPLLEIDVCDTGPGIDPVDRERIFGPFEQTGDPARSLSMSHGSGLGLTVARRLAHALGGSLQLAETGPAGSRFRLRLPLSHRPPG
jgi:PAS domain S-box-containing protein